jgi:hypothetical protein
VHKKGDTGMVELGKIQKPDAGDYVDKKKLYCVADIIRPEDAPDDYKELVDKYWDEVIQQLEKIEVAGKIKKIFCEIITGEDKDDLDILDKISGKLSLLVKKKVEDGGHLLPIESKEILGPYADWGNCLRVVFTKEVFARVLEFYKEFSEKRLQHIMEVIEKNLSEAEAGLLILKDEDRMLLQFPKDIEIFLVTPPSYDAIIRWFRENRGKKPSEEKA